ncbi:MAG: ribosomal L7Ae/L30e/S12e/Gadd45 family protein [Nitrososphaerales archaeon]
MVDQKTLQTVMRKALKTGKCVLGFKEVLDSVKGSMLIVYSSSLDTIPRTELLESAESQKVNTLYYEGNSMALGKSCGRQHRISVVAIKSAGDANLELLH